MYGNVIADGSYDGQTIIVVSVADDEVVGTKVVIVYVGLV